MYSQQQQCHVFWALIQADLMPVSSREEITLPSQNSRAIKSVCLDPSVGIPGLGHSESVLVDISNLSGYGFQNHLEYQFSGLCLELGWRICGANEANSQEV